MVQAIKSLSKKIAATYQPGLSKSEIRNPKSFPSPTDRLDALKKLHNTRSNITKWTKKRDNAADPNAAKKAQDKLDELNDYKNTLEIFLKEAEAHADKPTA